MCMSMFVELNRNGCFVDLQQFYDAIHHIFICKLGVPPNWLWWINCELLHLTKQTQCVRLRVSLGFVPGMPKSSFQLTVRACGVWVSTISPDLFSSYQKKKSVFSFDDFLSKYKIFSDFRIHYEVCACMLSSHSHI